MNDAKTVYKLLYDCGIGILLPRQLQEYARRAVATRSVVPLYEAMGQLGSLLAYEKMIEAARAALRVLILALGRMTAQERLEMVAQIERALLERGIGAKNETLAIAFALAGDCEKARGYLAALSAEIDDMYGLGEHKCQCRDKIKEFVAQRCAPEQARLFGEDED